MWMDRDLGWTCKLESCAAPAVRDPMLRGGWAGGGGSKLFLFYRWLTAPLFSLLRGLGACVGMQAVLGCDCWGGCGGPSGLDILFKPLYCEHYDLHVRPQLSSTSILLCCFCHPSFPVRSSFELHHRRQAWADGSVRFPPLDLVWDLTAGHCPFFSC